MCSRSLLILLLFAERMRSRRGPLSETRSGQWGVRSRRDGFQVVEWRGTDQGQSAAERLLERAHYVSYVPGDVVYGIDFGDEEGASLFGESAVRRMSRTG